MAEWMNRRSYEIFAMTILYALILLLAGAFLPSLAGQTRDEQDSRLSLLGDAIRGGDHSFATYYKLGAALREKLRPEEALKAYEAAEHQANTDQQRSMSLVREAEICQSLGRNSDALARVKRSIALYPFEEAEQLMGKLRQSQGGAVSAGQIAAALHTKGIVIDGAGVPGDSASAGAINLPIQFVYDRAEMTPDGLNQAQELGKALQQGFASSAFLVIGHTDKRGDDSYNLELSRRRAQAVVDFLVSHYGISSQSFTVEGRGKTELLAAGDSEEDHQVNRRVEVQAR